MSSASALHAAASLLHSLPAPIAAHPAHAAAAARYKAVHQRMRMEMNMEEGSARCESELLLLPLTDDPIAHIQINCKHDLDSVSVDGIPARWERVPTRSRIDVSTIRDARSLELHHYEMMDVAEAGEVRVILPQSCQRAKSVSIAPPPPPPQPAQAQVAEEKKMEDGEEQKDDAAAKAASASAASAAAAAQPEIIREPLLLRFTYTLPRLDSRPGLHFLTRTPFAPNRLPQVSTSSSLTSGTSPAHWMPCIDHWEERMSWEISVVVASEYTVLASGVLVGKTVLPAAAASPSPAGSSSMVAAGARVRWDFHLDTPVLARSIGFCVAPFVVDLPAGAGAGAGGGNAVPDASAAAASSTAASSSPVETRAKEPTLAWYSVPSRPAGLNKLMESSIAAPAASSSSSSSAASSQGPHKHASTVDLLRTTCASTVPGLVSLYEHLFGSPYPFDALRIAFMEEPASLSMHGGFAGLILLDRDLLYDASLIDQVFTTTEALAYAVAMNWLSHTLWLAHAADWWLLQGIAGWAAATYCASVFGNNFVQHGLYLKAQMVLEEEAELGAWFSKVRADEDFAHEAPDARPWLRTLESHALYHPAVTSMTEIENTVFRAKAHVVFQMLAQKIGGGILGSSGSATVAVSAGAGASAGTGSGPQAPSSGAAVSSGGNVAVRNLIQRLVDEFTYSTAAEDTDSAASARPLSTLRLLEICTELSAAGSGIASLSKAVGSAAASSSAASALSSSELLLTESGQELKAFFDQWIWCNGYPNLDMRFEYKPKNKTTSLRIQQRPMWHRGAAHDEINPQVLRFAGPLKCRIVEVERVNDQERLVPAHMGAGMIGTHHSTAAAGDASAPAPSASSNFTVIEPGSTIEYEFVCSSKVRRNRKRKKLDDASLSLLPIDKLLVRHNDTPLHYARIDPVWSWFALVPSQQDAIHSLWKLNTEKDMLGQLDAIKQVAHAWRNHSNTSSAASAGAGGIEAAALAAKEAASGSAEEKMPDDIFPKSLYSTLQSPVTFWPVRVAAAQALAESATSGPNAAANYKYLQVLVDWFKARYVDGWNPLLHASSGVMAGAASAAMDDDGTGVSRSPADAALAADDLQLRANEFSNISEYMVKQSLPLVLSKIRVQPRNHSLEAGSSSLQPSTPPEVVRFLVWLLRDNDNSENAYSDVIYLGSLLRSLGNLVFPADGSLDVERAQVVQEAQRYLHYDQVVPSYHYTLTQAAMTSLARLERRGQLPSAFTQINFALFAGPTFDRGVRLAAFKSLLTVAPVRPASDRSFTLVLDVLEAESMPGLSHKMMAAWARAVARGSFSSRLLRENCAENTEIMNRIWNIASSATNDPRLAASALALWRCVWGTQTVPASLASPAQRTASNVARGTLQAAVKQAQLEAQLEAQEITARRVARGKHYLRDLRSSREFVSSSSRGGRASLAPAAAAPKRKSIKIIRGTGGFVAAEATEEAAMSMEY